MFPDVPPGTFQLTAQADGFAAVTARIEDANRHSIGLVLARGYRVNATLEFPPDAGRQVVRVVYCPRTRRPKYEGGAPHCMTSTSGARFRAELQ